MRVEGRTGNDTALGYDISLAISTTTVFKWQEPSVHRTCDVEI